MKHLLPCLAMFCIVLVGCQDNSRFNLNRMVKDYHANLSWDFLNYNFGNIPIGTSSVHTFTLSNSGTIKLTSCDNVTISDTTNFSLISSTCSESEMGINESCTVDIDFHPQSVGPISLEITRACSNQSERITSSNIIQVEGVGIPKVRITGAGFGDLATAEAYVNSFKVGQPVTETSYDSVSDIFEFTTEAESDFSNTTGFMSGARSVGTFEDPHNLIKTFGASFFAGNSNKTYIFKDISVKNSNIFDGGSSNNIKIEKFTFNQRGIAYSASSVFEFDDAIGTGDQPKFVFNYDTIIKVNNDFTLLVGTHGRYTEFCDLRTNNTWWGYNTYEFGGNFTIDNQRGIAGVGTKLQVAKFIFRKSFDIININGLKVFKTAGQTQDAIRGTNHVYFYSNIGSTEQADFPADTFGTVNIIYHASASKQFSNSDGIEGDLQKIIDAGGTVLFDL